MLPPQERFESCELAGAEADLRLIERYDPVGAQRLFDLGAEGDAPLALLA
jgi:hypothetical protein